MRWIIVGRPNQPGTSIVLYPPGVDPGITDDERRVIAEMMAKAPTPSSPWPQPTDQPYGVRDCAVRDPAGTLIRINEVR